MNKLFKYVLLVLITSVAWADISTLEAMDLEMRAEEIRKELNISTPTIEDKRLGQIRAELNLDFDTSSKDALLGNNKADSVQPLLSSSDSESLSDSMSSVFSSIKESLNIDKDESYSFSHSLKSFYETIGLEEEEKSSGFLSMFSFEDKPKSLNIPILGGIYSTSTTVYKGMKQSGQSAELMSGMMYNSSKVYNTMFGVFDDSPFNIFEGEEESSIFDIFD